MRLLLERRLADHPLAEREAVGEVLALGVGVGREQLEDRLLVVAAAPCRRRRAARRPPARARESTCRATVSRSRWPCSMRVKRVRLVLSQSCSWLTRVVSASVRIIWLMLSLSTATSPRASTSIDWREVALGHGGGDVADGAHLAGQVAGELVDVVGEVAPDARRAGHVGLAAEPPLDADVARHAGDLIGERRQRARSCC